MLAYKGNQYTDTKTNEHGNSHHLHTIWFEWFSRHHCAIDNLGIRRIIFIRNIRFLETGKISFVQAAIRLEILLQLLQLERLTADLAHLILLLSNHVLKLSFLCHLQLKLLARAIDGLS